MLVDILLSFHKSRPKMNHSASLPNVFEQFRISLRYMKLDNHILFQDCRLKKARLEIKLSKITSVILAVLTKPL